MLIDPVLSLAAFHSAIGKLDFSAIESMLASDARYVSIKVGALEGREAIIAAFRRYFAEYPDQVAQDDLIERISPLSARAVWHVSATSSTTGLPLERHGEETIGFDAAGRVISVDVTDY